MIPFTPNAVHAFYIVQSTCNIPLMPPSLTSTWPHSTCRSSSAALGELFNSATAIMHWLSECAQIIAASDEPVQWTTPLGLPVVQPYRCACKSCS